MPFMKFLRLGLYFLTRLRGEIREQNLFTEKLRIHCREVDGWIGGCWNVKNESRGYHGLLKMWWDHFGLKGDGLIIGEEGIFGNNVKRKLKNTYTEIEVFTVSLKNSDIIWDITKPLKLRRSFDWIICQAVLEHVKDPVSAVKNMADVLKVNGRMYVHTVGPEFEYHPFPIDCYRFFRDAILALAQLANLKVEDIMCTYKHCFAVYRKSGDAVQDHTET